jgi:sugar phosphate permease
MLIGLCGAELVGRESVGASEGFLGWVAYLGAASAGFPLSLLVRRFGWPLFFQTLLATVLLAFGLLATIGNAPSFTQREGEAQRAAQPA